MKYDLDIVIPCYFEGQNIISLLDALEKNVQCHFKVLICYDEDEDDTLTIIKNHQKYKYEILFIKNQYIGLHGAVKTGFEKSTSKNVMMMPADDSSNSNIIDQIVELHSKGAEVVCPSRFIKGGSIKGYPKIKYIIVRTAAFLLFFFALIPIHDATNGFRSFSRKVITKIPLESKVGGTYSIELLVKCHRLRWSIKELPSIWVERKAGNSKFKLWKWIPHYFIWFLYAFSTTYLKKKK